MKFKKAGNTYCVRIYKGEELVETLTGFLKEKKITAGSVTGIGATDDVTIGYFDSDSGEYHKTDLKEPFEILNLTGNISTVDGVPFTHLHIILGDEKFMARGGHLFRAMISVTCEIYITAVDAEIKRVHDEETGLKLLEF